MVAAAFLATHLGNEAGAAGAARALVQNEVQRRQQLWVLALQKRAPVLSGGDGSYRPRSAALRRRQGVGGKTRAGRWT